MPKEEEYIGINIKPKIKKDFKKLCKDRGSNMTIELRRFIYEQLKNDKTND